MTSFTTLCLLFYNYTFFRFNVKFFIFYRSNLKESNYINQERTKEISRLVQQNNTLQLSEKELTLQLATCKTKRKQNGALKI